jgi:restriction system protein
MANKRSKGPAFLRFVAPIVETLREVGNSSTAGDVTDRVMDRMNLSDAERDETTSNGQSRVRNQIGWARFYLAKAGLIDASSRHGRWTLTEAGLRTRLDMDAVLALFKSVQTQFKRTPPTPLPGDIDAEEGGEESPEDEAEDYKIVLLTLLRELPPAGFERLCRRLLDESGIKHVIVTGKSNDGGIDGQGVLEVNPLVTFKVLFQCKRYGIKGKVSPTEVRDFRGAMAGRADKGIIFTTGGFTTEARKEATRDGVPPIELVDDAKLVTLFERHRLGLRPKQTFEVDVAFFEEFQR